MFPNGKDMAIINNNKTSHREKENLKLPQLFLVLWTYLWEIFPPSLANWFTMQITVFEWYVQTITCLQLTMETVEKGVKQIQSHWCHSGVFNVNFEHISHLFLLFMLLTLSTYLFAGIGKWLWLTINLLIPVMSEKIPRSTWIQIYPLKVLPPYYRNHSTNFHFEFNHWFLYKGNNAFKKLSREENAVILL